jgi:hypothetical protein
VIGDLPAAGNSTGAKTYSYTDNNPVQNDFYRIGEYDIDGRLSYSSVFRSSCTATDAFSIRPNPVRDMLFINIVTQAIIRLFDSRGALVKITKAAVLQGDNQFVVDVQFLASGVYVLSVSWGSGQMQKTMQVVKQ